MGERNISLLYLTRKKFESDHTSRGAFLLTDQETRPLEFRCTNPIKPSQLQSVLYGQILEQFICVELIGQPLMKSTANLIEIVLINDPLFLDLRQHVLAPLVLITNSETCTAIDDSNHNIELLGNMYGNLEPYVICAHPDFPEDLAVGRQILAPMMKRLNVVEPFRRILSALDQVHQQKLGD